jgi:hypothetical protein
MRLDHSLQSGLLLLQFLSGIFMLAKGFWLGDPSADFFSMVAKLLDFLHGFVEMSDQGMSPLYLICQTSHVIMTFCKQYHSISSFVGSAQEVTVLGMLHLVVLIVTQHGQCFMCSISNSSIERPPRSSNLDHLANTVDTIGRRPLI